MAAVGAGVIPATLAALLPVLVGRRRRRRSYGTLPFPHLQSSLTSDGSVPYLKALPGLPRDAEVNLLLSYLNSLPVASNRHVFPVLTSTVHTNPVSATMYSQSTTTSDSSYVLPATSATLPVTLPLNPASHTLLTKAQATEATHYTSPATHFTPFATQRTLPASTTSHVTKRTLPASQRTLPKLFVSRRTLPPYSLSSLATQRTLPASLHPLPTTLPHTIPVYPAILYPGEERWTLGGEKRRETGMRETRLNRHI